MVVAGAAANVARNCGDDRGLEDGRDGGRDRGQGGDVRVCAGGETAPEGLWLLACDNYTDRLLPVDDCVRFRALSGGGVARWRLCLAGRYPPALCVRPVPRA